MNPQTNKVQTRLIWTFAEDAFALGDQGSVTFKTRVTLEAKEGANSGSDAQYVGMYAQGFNATNGPNGTDSWDLDGDGNTSEKIATSTVTWTVSTQSGATIEKWVKGSQDSDWVKEGVSAATVDDSGTHVDYKLNVQNDGTRELKNIVIYDVLPYVGDTAIGADLAGMERESEFLVSFRELTGDLPAGVSVQYSTSNNPPRPELFPAGQSGAEGTWSDALPEDPTTVRALRYVIASLPAGKSLDLLYRGDVPNFVFDASTPTDTAQVCFNKDDGTPYKAWNNIAFRADRVSGGQTNSLLPAEVPKVSIREICGLIGDYAWFDTDGNGRQDDGEKAAPGVVFQLVDSSGAVVTDATGAPIQATTNTDGYYAFDVPIGDWKVQVASIPAGYVLTKANAEGVDDAVDSDVTALNTPTAAVTIDKDNLQNTTLDAGLIPVVSVGDFVWVDGNNNGVQDDGDASGLNGVTLTLTGPDGSPVKDVFGNDVGPVLTADKAGKPGYYEFPNLPVLAAGQSYTVTVTPPAGYSAAKTGEGTPATDSSTGSAASGALTTPGASDVTLDFGFVPKVSIGDFVWLDSDGDGIQDAGEPGIPGVVLVLTGPDGKAVTDIYGNEVTPVTTDGKGFYSFAGLPVLKEGQSYTVTIDRAASAQALAGLVPTITGQGDGASDSSTWTATSEGLVRNGDSDVTLDFGFVLEPAKTLAVTGANVLGLTGVAGALLLIGGAAIVTRRRQTA